MPLFSKPAGDSCKRRAGIAGDENSAIARGCRVLFRPDCGYLSTINPVTNNPSAGSGRSPGIYGWLLLSPLLVWLIAFVVAPTAIMFVYSFCQSDDLGRVVYAFTLDNYERIFLPDYLGLFAWSGGAFVGVGLGVYLAFKLARVSPQAVRDRTLLSPVAWAWLLASVSGYAVLRHGVWAIDLDEENHLKTFLRSLELAGWTTAICLIAGYPVAYFIGRRREAVRNGLLMLVMIPFWTNFLIRTYAWINLLKDEGLPNRLLLWLHVIHEPLHMNATYASVLIGTVYAYLPFMILPIYGSVEKLDGSLIEASLDLGAGPWRTMTDVILPLTRPGIIAGCLLVFVPAIGTFVISDILGGGRILLIGNTIDDQFHAARDKPFGSALGIVLLAVFAVAYFLSQRRAAE